VKVVATFKNAEHLEAKVASSNKTAITLTIKNPDGQTAVETYTFAPPTITAANAPSASDQPIKITGDNFHPKFSASYTVAGGSELKVDPDNVTFTDSKNIAVTISGVTKQDITLKIANPDGASASVKVTMP
jgi:IPT/TIG domain